MHALKMSNRLAGSAYGSNDRSSLVGGAGRHQLIAILYAEVEQALDAMPLARRHSRHALYAEKQARVLTILNGLENALDHKAGGQLANDLTAVYRGVRAAVLDASRTRTDAPLATARSMIGAVADAWRQIGGG